jgi:hypothetical protein
MPVGLGNSNADLLGNVERGNRPDISKGLQFSYRVSKDFSLEILK